MDNVVPMSTYELTPTELHKLQHTLLLMLIEFDRICKKNNIRYCIIAGTLLGAVRHQGFIPWDDDLDVAMLRTEYDKFREVCEFELDCKKFFFQDNTTDPQYPWGYGRLRRIDSEFVRVGQEHLAMKTGIFVDIFPLDGVPDFSILRGIFTFRCLVLRKIQYARVGAVSEKSRLKKAIYKMLMTIPLSWVFKRLDALQQHGGGQQTKYVRILTFPTPKRRPYGYLRKWYSETGEIIFEGIQFPCVKDWDAYLTYKYGEYMIEPPVESRRWHPVSRFRLPSDE